MRKELEDAAREGASRRSNSPVPALAELERTGSLSDLTGNAKAAGFFSDGIPKRIHLKFVSIKDVECFRFPCENQKVSVHLFVFFSNLVNRMHMMVK